MKNKICCILYMSIRHMNILFFLSHIYIYIYMGVCIYVRISHKYAYIFECLCMYTNVCITQIHMYIFVCDYICIDLICTVFANGFGRPGINLRSRHTKDFKMVHDTSLLNTQQYKVRIKNKVEQSRERSSSALPYTSV